MTRSSGEGVAWPGDCCRVVYLAPVLHNIDKDLAIFVAHLRENEHNGFAQGVAATSLWRRVKQVKGAGEATHKASHSGACQLDMLNGNRPRGAILICTTPQLPLLANHGAHGGAWSYQ